MERTYAHMCRDEHQQIGHNDSEHERCPLCRANDRVTVLEDAIKYAIGMIQGGFPMEAALEMDRRIADPDFDFSDPTASRRTIDDAETLHPSS